MVLKNNTLEKLTAEGKVSHLSEEESSRIYQNLSKKSIDYRRIYKRKEFYSHVAASKLILNS